MSRKIFTIDETPVSEPLEKRMRNWLVVDECIQIRQHVKGCITKHSALSAEHRFNSIDHPQMIDEAHVEMKRAQEYQTFLNVLEELTARKHSFVSVKISPI